MTELLTSRLRLRRFRAADGPALAAAHLDAETMRYFPYGAARTEAEALARAEAQIAAYNAHWSARGYGVWALENRADGGFVGRVGLRWLEELGEVELLYLIVRARWRQGLASEAAARTLASGFDEAGLDRIVALAMPANLASRRVMEKVGMRCRDRVRIWGLELVRYAVARAGAIRPRRSGSR